MIIIALCLIKILITFVELVEYWPLLNFESHKRDWQISYFEINGHIFSSTVCSPHLIASAVKPTCSNKL